jgi:hypothetical protein
MSSNNFVDGDLVPELGDEIKIIGKTGRIHGIIVYRSENMIRVRSFSSKTVVYEFPLDENGDYVNELGITETYLDPEKKARDPHFSIQMEVAPGSELEFYDREGNTVRKIVHQVIATDEQDGLKFEDGEVMDFGFVGLPDPYVTFLDVTNVEGEINEVNAAAAAAAERVPDVGAEELNEEDDLIAKLLEQQGDISQDETAQINKPYPEDQQRQDMFISVMQMIAPNLEQQKNPRFLRRAYIETDLLAALKRSVVELSPQGQPLLNTSKSMIVDTVGDVLQHSYPPAILPIVNVYKVLTTACQDKVEEDVEYVSEHQSLIYAKEGFYTFSKAVNVPRRTENAFELYHQRLNDAFKTYGIATPADFKVNDDIEVYVGKPGNTVKGFDGLLGTTRVLQSRFDEAIHTVVIDDTQNVDVYTVRLLAQGKSFMDPIANKIITLQPADTATRAGCILLSPNLAYTRIQQQSSVLLWDIHASEWCRNNSYKLKSRILKDKTIQLFDKDEPVSVLIRDVLRTRLQPSLSLVTWANACVIDSIGLRALELTQSQMKIFHDKMVEGQTNWELAMVNIKQDAATHLALPSSFPVKPVILMKDSPMYSDATLSNATLTGFIEKFSNRETLYKDYDLAMMSALMDETYYGTLLAYWSALVSQTSHELVEETRRMYVNEIQKQLRKQETQRDIRRRFTAAPIINKCTHVREYEIVNKINNDSERIKALESFVRKYNGGTQNNFVKCNKCLQNLVCKHELLLIQEYKIQDQSTIIHKQLVLDFGGPVFMGTYICKNCGQKISNLEFDTHLEFDDEGRPLVGRAVLLPDEVEGVEEEAATKASHDARAAYITDSSKDLQRDFALYQNLKRVFEEAHILLADDLAKTLLEELKIYLSTLTSKTEYNKFYMKFKQPHNVPEYDTFYSQNLVGALGALAVIELQNLPTDVQIPNRQCPYSRSGFPIDYLDGVKTDSIDMGAIKYITCVLGLISSSSSMPWSIVRWAGTSKPVEERHKMIQTALITVLASMRGLDATLKAGAKKLIPKLMDPQTKRLRKALEERTTVVQVRMENANGSVVEMKPSEADRLPSHFHPCPRYEETEPASAVKMGNANRFESNVQSAAIPEIKPVVSARIQQLQQDIMYKMNIDVDTSVPNRTFKMEDVGRVGFGYKSSTLTEPLKAEYELMKQSYQHLDRRDSSRPNTGTHMYVPWTSPEPDVAKILMDESIYYKLFSKVCARGDTLGTAHEFTYGNACRQCGFQLHDALIYETNSEIPPSARNINDLIRAQEQRRKTAVEEACRAIGVEISEISFNELRSSINMRKQVAQQFELNGGNLIDRIRALAQFLPEQSKPVLDKLQAGIETINATEIPLIGDARYAPLRDFYRGKDNIQEKLLNLIAESLPGASSIDHRKEKVNSAFTKMEAILGKIYGDECIRSIKRIFIFNSRFIRENKLEISIPIHRWIPNAFKGHVEDLERRVAALDEGNQRSQAEFNELFNLDEDAGERDLVSDVLQRISHRLGGLLRYWQTNIRPNQVFVTQGDINEYSAVLHWCINEILHAELEQLNTADTRHVKDFIGGWIVNSIESEDKIYATYRKSTEEIKASMNDRREREKAHKIKKQDDEKDPEIRKLMRTALKLGYADEAILRKSGYNAQAEALRFAELQALGIADDRAGRGNPVPVEEGMGDVRDEDGGDT